MTKPADLSIEDGLELSLDTLDQWEQELDEFATGILNRIETIGGRRQASNEPALNGQKTNQPSE